MMTNNVAQIKVTLSTSVGDIGCEVAGSGRLVPVVPAISFRTRLQERRSGSSCSAAGTIRSHLTLPLGLNGEQGLSAISVPSSPSAAMVQHPALFLLKVKKKIGGKKKNASRR